MSETSDPAVSATVGVAHFIARIKNTPDEVFSRLVMIRHRRDRMTLKEWHALLDTIKAEPA